MKRMQTARERQVQAFGISKGWKRAEENGVERSGLYTTPRWRKARRFFLSRHPLCAACEADGKLETATVVDHIRPHRGDMELFWDEGNWQPLCKRCHDVKTAAEIRGRKDA